MNLYDVPRYQVISRIETILSTTNTNATNR